MPLTKAVLKWAFCGFHLDNFIVCYPLLAFFFCHIELKLLILTVEASHKGGLQGSLNYSLSTGMDKDFHPVWVKILKPKKLPGIQAITLPQLSYMQWQFIEPDA